MPPLLCVPILTHGVTNFLWFLLDSYVERPTSTKQNTINILFVPFPHLDLWRPRWGSGYTAVVSNKLGLAVFIGYLCCYFPLARQGCLRKQCQVLMNSALQRRTDANLLRRMGTAWVLDDTVQPPNLPWSYTVSTTARPLGVTYSLPGTWFYAWKTSRCKQLIKMCREVSFILIPPVP